MSTDKDRICMLNDQLRRDLTTGRAVMTPGIAALGSEAVKRLVQTIAIFDDFCTANDPHHSAKTSDLIRIPAVNSSVHRSSAAAPVTKASEFPRNVPLCSPRDQTSSSGRISRRDMGKP